MEGTPERLHMFGGWWERLVHGLFLAGLFMVGLMLLVGYCAFAML